MRAPSIVRLKRDLNLDNERAKQARAIMKWEAPPGTKAHHIGEVFLAWMRGTYGDNDPAFQSAEQRYDHQAGTSNNHFKLALTALDKLLETCGMEAVCNDDVDDIAHYCNTGDMYAPTLMLLSTYDLRGWWRRWHLGSLGDLIERHGGRYR